MGRPFFVWNQLTGSESFSASSTHADAAADNLKNATEDTWWRPAATSGTRYVTIDFGSAKTFDCIALLGQGLDGVTFSLRASTDNFSSSNVLVKGSTLLSAPVNAAWVDFTASSYRYWRVQFTGLSTASRLNFAGLMSKTLLPLFEDDWAANTLDSDGGDQYSAGGVYSGSYHLAATRKLVLAPGSVNASELADLLAWRDACIATRRPFFFVPDEDDSEVYFGTLERPEFSAPYREGMYRVQPLRMRSRGV